LNSSNFKVVYPESKPVDPNSGVLSGWDIEIAIDTQWAHSIAPRAKIIVVAAAGEDNEDLIDAIGYIVDHNLGYTVNDSWEVDQDDSPVRWKRRPLIMSSRLLRQRGSHFNSRAAMVGMEVSALPSERPACPPICRMQPQWVVLPL
jgi:hypothetical protein